MICNLTRTCSKYCYSWVQTYTDIKPAIKKLYFPLLSQRKKESIHVTADQMDTKQCSYRKGKIIIGSVGREIFSTNLEILYFLEDLLSPYLETVDRSFKKDI